MYSVEPDALAFVVRQRCRPPMLMPSATSARTNDRCELLAGQGEMLSRGFSAACQRLAQAQRSRPASSTPAGNARSEGESDWRRVNTWPAGVRPR